MLLVRLLAAGNSFGTGICQNKNGSWVQILNVIDVHGQIASTT